MARTLVPIADIVTPNRYELQSLTSRTVRTPEDAVAAARLLGRKAVLATSIPCRKDWPRFCGTGQRRDDRDAKASEPSARIGRSARRAVCGPQLAGRSRPARGAGPCGRVGRCALADADGRAEMRLAAMQDALVTAEPLELQDLS